MSRPCLAAYGATGAAGMAFDLGHLVHRAGVWRCRRFVLSCANTPSCLYWQAVIVSVEPYFVNVNHVPMPRFVT